VIGVLQFPGSCDERDAVAAASRAGDARLVWHEETDLGGLNGIIVPGGFSYGDYLRAGAIARFSPAMEAVARFASDGGPVLGICNGFQILLEAGLLPGAMLRNESLEFRCVWTRLRVENNDTPFTRLCRPGQVIRIPISHGEGNYFADEETLDRLEANNGVLLRYCDAQGNTTQEANPNGSRRNIAGIVNMKRNVAAMMPHPERCTEAILGGEDGRLIFGSIIAALAERSVVAS
jgi:phosphoribosylformylglycinamidine synthase